MSNFLFLSIHVKKNERELFFSFFKKLLLVVLRIKPRAQHMSGRACAIKPHVPNP